MNRHTFADAVFLTRRELLRRVGTSVSPRRFSFVKTRLNASSQIRRVFCYVGRFLEPFGVGLLTNGIHSAKGWGWLLGG